MSVLLPALPSLFMQVAEGEIPITMAKGYIYVTLTFYFLMILDLGCSKAAVTYAERR